MGVGLILIFAVRNVGPTLSLFGFLSGVDYFLRRSVVAVDTDVDLTLMFAGRRSGVGFI